MTSETRREKLWAGLGLLAITATLLARALQPPAASILPLPAPVTAPERLLTPGVSIERSLPTGSIDLYRIPLKAGDFLHAVAFQQGVDVSLRLVRPSGREVIFVDSPSGDQFSEPLFAVAEEPGPYQLQIKSEGSLENRGHYRLELEKPRPASQADRLRAQAALEFAQGEELRRVRTPEARRAAIPKYENALRLWEQDGNREQQGETLYRLGWVHDDLGELKAAQDSYSQALGALEGRGTAAVVSNHLGFDYATAGQPSKARNLYQRALRIGDLVTQAGALNNLGLLDQTQGELLRAQEEFEAALAIARKVGLHSFEGRILYNQMWLSVELGDMSRALKTGGELRDIQRFLAGFRVADTLVRMGLICNRIGWTAAALRYLGDATEAARKENDLKSLITALAELGEMSLKTGDVQNARRILGELWPLSMSHTADLSARANALTMVGRLRWSLGERAEAFPLFDQAESIYRNLGDLSSVGAVLIARAMVLRDQGRLDEARAAITESLQEIEKLRARPAERELRASILASRSAYYALYVEVLMLLHDRNPGAGFDRQAFEASELMRARVLLEELAEARGLRAVPQRLENDITAAKPVSLAEVQALLDEDTAVLAYSLGEKRSFLWKIKNTSVESFPLAPGADLASRVRRAYELLIRAHPSQSIQAQTTNALADLGHILLAPLAPHLTEKHLIIVSDDALRYVPFAVLPEPAIDAKAVAEPLMVRHALVSLPSASLAVLLRSDARQRPPDPGDVSIAVFADPVFRDDDGRVSARVQTKTVEPFDRFERLVYSAREADAIVKLVPPGEALKAVGFAASRQMITAPELAQYRYIHIATHSLIKPRHPDLSGIVLSRFDQDGQPVDGFLTSYQVYDLNLNADLVVLSACRTAIDARLHGEGLSSLTRGFMYAGAKRVMASLWDVDDHATSVMMPIFYDALLRKGMSPADALRKAQIDMMNSSRWAAPYYWAGFVLHGDWH